MPGVCRIYPPLCYAPFAAGLTHGRPQKKAVQFAKWQTPLARFSQGQADDDLLKMQHRGANSRGLPKLRVLYGTRCDAVQGRRIDVAL